MGGLYLFYRFTQSLFGPTIAWRALLLFLAFPAAFYLNLIYSEALFLLLTMWFFGSLYKRNYPMAAAAALLLPLTRPIGVLILAPFALFLLREALTDSKSEAHGMLRILPRLSDRRLLWLLAPIGGYLLAHVYMYASTGDFFVQENTISHFGSKWDLSNALRPDIFISALFDS